jgi:triosephosphate isomerase
MARKPILAGNWKMHKNRKDSAELAKALVAAVGTVTEADVVICPVYTSLDSALDAVKGSNIKVGAQNCHFEEQGAYTGEISAAMLKEVGVDYVIIGHSERRQYFNETDEAINKKAKALYQHGLTPIICVGETLEEREGDQMEAVITRQVQACLADLPAEKVAASVIAYEPVWAIGTGKTASREQAQEVHALIRRLLTEQFGEDTAQAVRIQYGGSVKPNNIAELMAQPDIDGALVGGAALDAESFAAIVKF